MFVLRRVDSCRSRAHVQTADAKTISELFRVSDTLTQSAILRTAATVEDCVGQFSSSSSSSSSSDGTDSDRDKRAGGTHRGRRKFQREQRMSRSRSRTPSVARVEPVDEDEGQDTPVYRGSQDMITSRDSPASIDPAALVEAVEGVMATQHITATPAATSRGYTTQGTPVTATQAKAPTSVFTSSQRPSGLPTQPLSDAVPKVPVPGLTTAWLADLQTRVAQPLSLYSRDAGAVPVSSLMPASEHELQGMDNHNDPYFSSPERVKRSGGGKSRDRAKAPTGPVGHLLSKARPPQHWRRCGFYPCSVCTPMQIVRDATSDLSCLQHFAAKGSPVLGTNDPRLRPGGLSLRVLSITDSAPGAVFVMCSVESVLGGGAAVASPVPRARAVGDALTPAPGSILTHTDRPLAAHEHALVLFSREAWCSLAAVSIGDRLMVVPPWHVVTPLHAAGIPLLTGPTLVLNMSAGSSLV